MATFANEPVPERQSYGNLFDVLNDTVTMWTVGADLAGRISGAFGIEAFVQYKASQKRFDHVSGVPNFTGRLDPLQHPRQNDPYRRGYAAVELLVRAVG